MTLIRNYAVAGSLAVLTGCAGSDLDELQQLRGTDLALLEGHSCSFVSPEGRILLVADGSTAIARRNDAPLRLEYRGSDVKRGGTFGNPNLTVSLEAGASDDARLRLSNEKGTHVSIGKWNC